MSTVVSPEELARRRTEEPGLQLIDVRTRDEYEEAHLDGATLMDMSSSSFMDAILALPKGQPYALYCATGGRSALACSFMEMNGFTDVSDLAGGIEAWQDADLPVVSAAEDA